MANPILIKKGVELASNKKFWIILLITIFIIITIIFLPAILIVSIFYQQGENISTRVTISDEVQAYSTIIKIQLQENNLNEEWEDVIKAIIMQESGGNGLDPMQSSECGFNTKYPNTPNGIQDPLYSIEVGIKNFADILNKLNLEKPTDDYNLLQIALQSYNFGSGYITYVNNNGGLHSLDIASSFSLQQQEKLRWDSYGDIYYVQHIWRYLPTSYPDYENLENNSSSDDTLFSNPMTLGTYRVTQEYGNLGHKGIDLGASEGTPIYASADGYVTFAGYGTSANGFNGYGYCVLIDHKNGYYTMYAHASELHISQGQYVHKGQLIAGVGNTGNSFGNHLHFEIRTGYQYPRINPSDYIIF